MSIPRFLVTRLAVLGFGVASLAVPAAHADTHVSVGVGIGVPLPNGYAEVNVGRDRYYYHRGTFYRPGPHGYYVVRPPRGAIIRDLPPRYTRVYYGGTIYYRYDDVYYRPAPGGYVVVEPPSTVVVTQAPSAPVATTVPKDDDYQSVWVGEVEYKFHDGQFFKRTPDGLIWVEAPAGAVTKNLPPDAQSVWYQDVEYFECNDIYFRKTPDGYKVVDAPWKKDGPGTTVGAPPPPAPPANGK